MNKKTLIFITVFLLFISSVSAITLTTFNDTSTSKSATNQAGQTLLGYIELPKTAIVSSANIGGTFSDSTGGNQQISASLSASVRPTDVISCGGLRVDQSLPSYGYMMWYDLQDLGLCGRYYYSITTGAYYVFSFDVGGNIKVTPYYGGDTSSESCPTTEAGLNNWVSGFTVGSYSLDNIGSTGLESFNVAFANMMSAYNNNDDFGLKFEHSGTVDDIELQYSNSYLNFAYTKRPYNPYVKLGTETAISKTGFDTGSYTSSDLTTYVNSYLDTCSAIDGNCSIPVYVYTLREGIIYANSINIEYEEVTDTINTTTINISIYDRETGSLLTQDVDITFLNNFNTTISDGELSILNSSLQDGYYTVQAVSENYGSELVTFYFSNTVNMSVDFYMLNLTGANTGLLFISTLDLYSRTLEGASLELKEYNADQSSFIKVSECSSNSNGECVFFIELNKKLYSVTGTTIIDNVLFYGSTSQEIIQVDNDVRQLILFPQYDVPSIITDSLIVDYTSYKNSLNENTRISQIDVDFYTTDNTKANVCLEYLYKINSVWYSLTNVTYCAYSSDATIIGGNIYINESYDYKVEIYVYDGGKINIDTYYYNSNNSLEYILNTRYPFAKYFIVLLVIGWLAFCLSIKNISIYPFGDTILIWALVPLFPKLLYISFAIIKTAINYFIYKTSLKKND